MYKIGLRDFRKKKSNEARMQQLINEQKSKLADFCDIVSHNLRGPLVSISMLADAIELTSDLDEQKILVSKFSPLIGHLQSVFSQLVESLQISQDLMVKSEAIDLQDCFFSMLENFEQEINHLKTTIKVEFTEAPFIHFPIKYLQSIFFNLISNSLRYRSPDKAPLIAVKSTKTDNGVLLSFSDNGLGIDLVRHRDHIFKMGKVFHDYPNAKGFGLFITKSQLDAMGSKIWVESFPNEGATFFIEFKPSRHVF